MDLFAKLRDSLKAANPTITVSVLEWENTEDHGPEFGVAYAACYRIYEKTVTG